MQRRWRTWLQILIGTLPVLMLPASLQAQSTLFLPLLQQPIVQPTVTKLTENGEDPAWSPDGTKIAYNQLGEIWVMNVDGSQPVKLGDSENVGNLTISADLQWSPDSTQIMLAAAPESSERTYEIFVIQPDGTHLTRLTDDFEDDTQPEWSPDGSKIAYVHAGMIYVMKADGSEPTQLTDGSFDRYPTWSPDGTRIAFSHDGQMIDVINADGTGRTHLTPPGASVAFPSWSPDGTRIAYTSEQSHPDGPNEDISVVWADGSANVQLTTATTFDTLPKWSPDGTKILYRSDTLGENGWRYTLSLMNADGTDPISLTSHAGSESDAAWSPDGTQLAFFSDGYTGAGLYVRDMTDLVRSQ